MLKGKTIRLREFRAEDIPAVTAMRNDEDARAQTTRSVITPVTEAVIRAEFEAETTPEAFRYILEDREGRLVGFCRFENNFKDRRAVISFEIRPQEHGKGYGSEALELILGMVFQEMNMNKCSTLILSGNRAARHILEAAGFSVEAVLRDDVFRHGVYEDALVMGLLAREYRERQSGAPGR